MMRRYIALGVAGGVSVAVAHRLLGWLWPPQDNEPAIEEAWAVEEVLALWFGGDIKDNYSRLWFASPGSKEQAAVDERIRSRFGALLARAEAGGLRSWKATPRSFLALIILLDQFAR
jgi:uncharacterized protein (DUF924 family)